MLAIFDYLKHALIAFISRIIASIAAITHTTTAAIYAYISAVWAGTEDPLWFHLVFVPSSAIAGIAVGLGIVFERPKYSAPIHRVAFWLVVVGVAVELVCTISLFVVDERVSNAQQLKIITLEEKLAPRNLSGDDVRRIALALKPLGGVPYDLGLPIALEPGSEIINQIIGIARDAGWHLQSVQGNVMKGLLDPISALMSLSASPLGISKSTAVPQILVSTTDGLVGIKFVFDPAFVAKLGTPAYTFAQLLTEAGIAAEAVEAPNMNSDVIHIAIGTKP